MKLKHLLLALLLAAPAAWGQTSTIDDFPEQTSPSTSDWLLIDEGSGVFKSSSIGNVVDARATGKQVIWVPAGAMTPTVSNGSASLTSVETTAGRPDMNVLDFDASSDEHAQFSVAFPDAWDEGTVTFKAKWTSTATDTDGVAWGLQAVCVANDDTIDVAYGTAVVVTDDNISAAEDMLLTSESAAVTLSGSPSTDDLCYFRVFRDVSDGNDDMTEDARLIGIRLYWTTDAPTE